MTANETLHTALKGLRDDPDRLIELILEQSQLILILHIPPYELLIEPDCIDEVAARPEAVAPVWKQPGYKTLLDRMGLER